MRSLCTSAVAMLALLRLRSLPSRSNRPPKPIFPKALAPGDTIEFVAPAKYLDKDRVTLAKKRLEEMGFKVRIPDNLFRKKGFLGGSDEERAAELMAAFADPEVNAILPGTGGYGTTRIVDKLDYDVIRRNPKILVGFSDITALHIAINQQTGLVTFHSPLPEWGLGVEDNLSPFAAKWFWRAILAKSYRQMLADQALLGLHDLSTRADRYSRKPSRRQALRRRAAAGHAARRQGPRPADRRQSFGAARADGHAVRNPNRRQDSVSRRRRRSAYRVDRMLSTLRLAGKFDHVAGVILGQFTAREEEAKWDDDAVDRRRAARLLRQARRAGPGRLPARPRALQRHAAGRGDGGTGCEEQTLRVLENPVALPQ